jgi:hypothetical protein
MLRHLLLGFAFSLLALPASAQQPIALTPNTLRLAPGQASPPATLADMAFLVGHSTPARRRARRGPRWTGDGLGGVFEEVWTAPKRGVMVGPYRGLKTDGSPVFNELLLLREEKGSLMVRLKHFDPDLIGWEEKDGSTREATFTYRRVKS